LARAGTVHQNDASWDHEIFTVNSAKDSHAHGDQGAKREGVGKLATFKQ